MKVLSLLLLLLCISGAAAYDSYTFHFDATAGDVLISPQTYAYNKSVCLSDGTNCPVVLNVSGTVTQVNTGTGLTGGPITTTGTINVNMTAFCLANGTNCQASGSGIGSIQAADTSLITTNASAIKANLSYLTGNFGNFTGNASGWNVCITGQYSRWNGSAFGCFGDSSNPGTVTNVATDGTFLTGGPITTTGTIAFNQTYFNQTYDGRYYPYLTNPLNYYNSSTLPTYANGTGLLLNNNQFNLSKAYTDGLYGFTNGTGILLNGLQFNVSTAYLSTLYLGINAQATDSAKLAGQLPTFYLNSTGFDYHNVTNAPWLTTVPYQSSAAGWTNTTTIISTSLNLNITGNVTISVASPANMNFTATNGSITTPVGKLSWNSTDFVLQTGNMTIGMNSTCPYIAKNSSAYLTVGC